MSAIVKTVEPVTSPVCVAFVTLAVFATTLELLETSVSKSETWLAVMLILSWVKCIVESLVCELRVEALAISASVRVWFSQSPDVELYCKISLSPTVVIVTSPISFMLETLASEAFKVLPDQDKFVPAVIMLEGVILKPVFAVTSVLLLTSVSKSLIVEAVCVPVWFALFLSELW